MEEASMPSAVFQQPGLQSLWNWLAFTPTSQWELLPLSVGSQGKAYENQQSGNRRILAHDQLTQPSRPLCVLAELCTPSRMARLESQNQGHGASSRWKIARPNSISWVTGAPASSVVITGSSLTESRVFQSPTQAIISSWSSPTRRARERAGRCSWGAWLWDQVLCPEGWSESAAAGASCLPHPLLNWGGSTF